MNQAQQLSPSPLPVLKGYDNFRAWAATLIQTLRFHGLQDYILKDSKMMFKETQKQAFVMSLMTASVGPISQWLSDCGWQWSKVNQDPKEFYDFVSDIVRGVTVEPSTEELLRDRATLLKKLQDLRADQYTNLVEFRRAAEHLKRAYMRYDPVDEAWGLTYVLDGLRDGREVWHATLRGEMTAGRLTWKRLMREIERQATHEFGISHNGVRREDSKESEEESEEQDAGEPAMSDGGLGDFFKVTGMF